MTLIESFINDLTAYHGTYTQNPWADTDENYEVPHAAHIRRNQLKLYLEKRIHRASILLIAEACGYQGGHFTGIAMTSERMLLNLHPCVNSLMILGTQGQRTSRHDSPYMTKQTQKEKGFNEPTDTIVWSSCLNAHLTADQFLLWNIFPFHPYKKGNILSNRTPTDNELAVGLTYTQKLLRLFSPKLIFAVGKKSELTLTSAGYDVIGLRHPANGGALLFQKGLKEALMKNKVT